MSIDKKRLNIVKMSALQNLFYRFNAILIKIPTRYFVDIDKLIVKFLERQQTQNGHCNIEEHLEDWH